MADLKPCPCCGPHPEIPDGCTAHAVKSKAGNWRAECMRCGLRTDNHDNRADAIAAWNRRAPLAPLTEGEVDALAKVLIDYNGLPHDSIGKGIAMGKARAALAAFVAGRQGG